MSLSARGHQEAICRGAHDGAKRDHPDIEIGRPLRRIDDRHDDEPERAAADRARDKLPRAKRPLPRTLMIVGQRAQTVWTRRHVVVWVESSTISRASQGTDAC